MINGLPDTPINNQKIVFCQKTAEDLSPIINEQRKIFFNNRIDEVKDSYSLSKDEIKTIWNLFLAGEHPEYTNGRILEMLPEIERCKDTPMTNEVSWCFHSFKWVWSLIWKDYQLDNYVSLCTRFVLKKAANEKKYSGHKKAQEIFEAEFKSAYQRVKDKINIPTRLKKIEELEKEDSIGLFPLDQQAINAIILLEKQYNGKFASEMIDFLKSTPKKYTLQERAESWKQPLFFHKMLAGIVWNDWVKKRIELLLKKPPALPLMTLEFARKPMRKGTEFNKCKSMIVDHNGNPIAKIGRTSPLEIPSLELETVQKILSKGNAKELSTINSHRLFRWEIVTVTHQLLAGNPDMRAIRVEGGFSELATLIGAGSGRKAAEQVREIVIWQANTILDMPGEQGNMISYHIRTSGYKTKGMLTIILGEMMLPHYVFQLLGIERRKVEGRQLVPIVDIPPLVGRPADHGSQANFQMELMVAFRKRAVELVKEGGIYLPETELRLLANESGLPQRILKKVMDRWVQDGNDGPAFLDVIENDRYALGKSHSVAQDFIISAGKKSLRKSRAAKISIANRR